MDNDLRRRVDFADGRVDDALVLAGLGVGNVVDDEEPVQDASTELIVIASTFGIRIKSVGLLKPFGRLQKPLMISQGLEIGH